MTNTIEMIEKISYSIDKTTLTLMQNHFLHLSES